MSSHGYLGDPPQPERKEPEWFTWTCPRKNCGREIRAIYEARFHTLKSAHINSHITQDLRLMQLFSNLPPKPPSYYQKLKCNWTDITFLITRGIRIDEDIEWDKDQKYEPIYG